MLRGLVGLAQTGKTLCARQATFLAQAGKSELPAFDILPRTSVNIFSTSLFPHNAVPQEKKAPEPQPMQQSGKKPPDETEEEANSGTPGNMFKTKELGHMMYYPHYEKEYMDNIPCKHLPPEKLYQKTAFWAVTAMRKTFDMVTGYPNRMNASTWLLRFVFLETVAGVPGMVGGMLRHMKSLRSMNRDYGWIHCLLQEAENERMHLLTFLHMKNPSTLFRGTVLLTQGIFFNLYFIFYCLSPKHCHAFVGYLEEEAVRTYTHAIKELDGGELDSWKNMTPPKIAQTYWGLKEDATMKDLLLAVRADEYGHSHVNHTFSKLKQGEPNPFESGAHQFP